MRTSVKLGLALLALLSSGCTRQAWPIAVFAAAATMQTVVVVDAYCSQEDVDCTKTAARPASHYDTNADPYSSAVDWSE